MSHIENERRRLGQNIDEIEDRIKGATDLKGYFNRNTGIFLGSAVAAGVIVSVALRKRRHRQESAEDEDQLEGMPAEPSIHSRQSMKEPVRRFADRHKERIMDTFDSIVDGLIGVACGKIVSFIADSVPSFKSEYNAHQRDRSWSSIRTVNSNIPPDATTSSQ